jgi:hypothetical protein
MNIGLKELRGLAYFASPSREQRACVGADNSTPVERCRCLGLPRVAEINMRYIGSHIDKEQLSASATPPAIEFPSGSFLQT